MLRGEQSSPAPHAITLLALGALAVIGCAADPAVRAFPDRAIAWQEHDSEDVPRPPVLPPVPAEPMVPATPVVPADPVVPARPVVPAAPVVPADPVVPATPVVPALPLVPAAAPPLDPAVPLGVSGFDSLQLHRIAAAKTRYARLTTPLGCTTGSEPITARVVFAALRP